MDGAVKSEKRLLQYYLEKTSHTMTLCPEGNPLSLPLLEHLIPSRRCFTLYNLGVLDEQFFQQYNLAICLQERGRSI